MGSMTWIGGSSVANKKKIWKMICYIRSVKGLGYVSQQMPFKEIRKIYKEVKKENG